MKIIQKLLKARDENRPCWSFEYFPPKTEQVRLLFFLCYDLRMCAWREI